tara:strand:+ start:781 stop:1557 length:777 start_codon:yes stop_codon:yes gene_type:complete
MIISSWNVNSVRARIDNIIDYLKKFSPDVIIMQEIKTEEKNFPFDSFKKLKYECYVFGQKSYNGVAILSKKKIKKIETDLTKDKLKQSRTISAEIDLNKKKIQLINIYTPNGNPVNTDKYAYKVNWLNDLIKLLKKLLKTNANIVLGGDFNIIPAPEDVYNPKNFENDALFKLEIRKKLREIINLGFHDVYRHIHGEKEGYTFWNYMHGAWKKNHGLRIDHFLVSSSILNNIKNIQINKQPRGKIKPSDHTPIEIELA